MTRVIWDLGSGIRIELRCTELGKITPLIYYTFSVVVVLVGNVLSTHILPLEIRIGAALTRVSGLG